MARSKITQRRDNLESMNRIAARKNRQMLYPYKVNLVTEKCEKIIKRLSRKRIVWDSEHEKIYKHLALKYRYRPQNSWSQSTKNLLYCSIYSDWIGGERVEKTYVGEYCLVDDDELLDCCLCNRKATVAAPYVYEQGYGHHRLQYTRASCGRVLCDQVVLVPGIGRTTPKNKEKASVNYPLYRAIRAFRYILSHKNDPHKNVLNVRKGASGLPSTG